MSLGRVAQRNQPDGSLTSTGNRCSRWQLIKSLKTKTRRYAEVLLRYYIDGKHSLDRTPTVQQFYEKWIERKIEPLVRRNQIRDYRQAFGTYTCRPAKTNPYPKSARATCRAFRSSCSRQDWRSRPVGTLSTDRSALGIAMLKPRLPNSPDAIRSLDVGWPKARRERLIRSVRRRGIRSLPTLPRTSLLFSVRVLAVSDRVPTLGINRGLTWADLHRESRTIRIDKSRNLNADNDTKTTKSRKRKFYACRHTLVTERW